MRVYSSYTICCWKKKLQLYICDSTFTKDNTTTTNNSNLAFVRYSHKIGHQPNTELLQNLYTNLELNLRSFSTYPT